MCFFGICVVDTDAESYYGKCPHKILSQHERQKKGKYLEACLERQQHSMMLVLYVYGVMGRGTNDSTKQMDDALSKKWYRKYSATCGYVWACLYLELLLAFGLIVLGPWSGNTRRAIHIPEDQVGS